MLFSGLLILFALVLMIALLGIGISVLVYGLIKRDRLNIRTGLIITAIPFLVFIFYLARVYGFDKFAPKPGMADIVGTYYSRDDKQNLYTLEFHKDSSFSMSKHPDLIVCSEGRYEIDWQFEDNELSFLCNFGYTTARIDRSFTSFKIEFFQLSGESIYFEKQN